MVQVFPETCNQLQFNHTVATLKENIQMFNFKTDVYTYDIKSKLPGDLVSTEYFQARCDINESLDDSLKNLISANDLLREGLISNKYDLYNEESIER